jgi:hypothetical protein
VTTILIAVHREPTGAELRLTPAEPRPENPGVIAHLTPMEAVVLAGNLIDAVKGKT